MNSSFFPSQRAGQYFLTEGGVETEIMQKHGFDIPRFAVYELLRNPQAVAELRGMYRRYFDVVAANKMSALVGGLDYRASPDWGTLLGYSRDELAQITHQCIQFIRDIAAEYSSDIDSILLQGLVGPRADAYQTNRRFTEHEAQDYHSVQLQTLKAAQVDLACACTFSDITESIGVARAAAEIGVPLCISLCLTKESKRNSTSSLGDAITAIDAETNGSVEFYLLNCVHPSEYEPALEGSPGWTSRIRGVRPNASPMDKARFREIGHLEAGDPDELGRQVGDLAKRFPHMDIFGGCCGTWDTHLEQMALNLKPAAVLTDPVF